jgi:hypothetical protein
VNEPGPRSWLWLLLLTPLLPAVAAVPVAGRWALPLLAPLTLYPAFVERVRRGDHGTAWLLGMVWAVLLSAGVIGLAELWPGSAGGGILHGDAYRQQMLTWVSTGVGPENDWRQFVPIHLEHLLLFVALTWASGAYLGLVLGAILVDYMSYFVAGYGLAGGHPIAGAIVAWVPWSVLRVMSFVLLGCLFARPLLLRQPWPFGRRERQLMGVAAAGLAADIALKAVLAPTYGLWLRHMAQAAAAALYSGASGNLG